MLNQGKKDWKIASIQSDEELTLWKTRLGPQLPQAFEQWHRDRQRSYLAARKALSESLETLNLKGGSLAIESSHHLHEAPDLLVSLSHTHSFGASYIQKKSALVLSIGIDLERSDRPVKQEVVDYVAHANDQIHSLPKLQFWCAKEAAFKAISAFLGRPEGLNMSQVWVRDHQFGLLESSVLGTVQIEQTEVESTALTVVLAELNRPVTL